ncbi:MAG: biotin-dependent carboxyltransferase family protein [Hyphomicrobiaceae bacterium]
MSAAAVRILAAGPQVTIQDEGRDGHLQAGVTPAGPMDPLAFLLATRLAGSGPRAGAIEVSAGGLTIAAEGAPLGLAIAGGQFKVVHEGRPMPGAVLLTLRPGETLSIRSGEAGSWCYVAFAGRIALPAVLGSVATHTRSGLGGLAGRALRAGDLVPIGPSGGAGPETARIVDASPARDGREPDGTLIRVVPGPQDDYFAPDQMAAFLGTPWRLSARSDRMAYLMEGPALRHLKGFNIVSDGIPLGAIQVPGDGQPMVLMADRQPTGGYPKIATVIRADIGRLAQTRPGGTVRFRAVTVAAAVEAWRIALAAIAAAGTVPLVRTDLSSEHLLAHNLVSGVTHGDEDASAGERA